MQALFGPICYHMLHGEINASLEPRASQEPSETAFIAPLHETMALEPGVRNLIGIGIRIRLESVFLGNPNPNRNSNEHINGI